MVLLYFQYYRSSCKSLDINSEVPVSSTKLFHLFDFQNFCYLLSMSLNIFPTSRFLEHCVKSIQRRSFFRSAFSCIRTEYRKIRTRKTPYLDTFHAEILQSRSKNDMIQKHKTYHPTTGMVQVLQNTDCRLS